MGTSSSKDLRTTALESPHSQPGTLGRPDSLSPTAPESASSSGQARTSSASHGSRNGRGRAEFLYLGIGPASDRDARLIDGRKETKQEREARRLEKERIARDLERQRSMREESVDGGYLVTQGVYMGAEDFNHAVVRQLIIERRLAPFFRGLNDHSASWNDNQLVAAARGLPIPPDDSKSCSEPRVSFPLSRPKSSSSILDPPPLSPGPRPPINQLHPLANHSQPILSQTSSPLVLVTPVSLSTSSSLFRPRSKTLTSLSASSRNNSQADIPPREVNLAVDPNVDGKPIETILYANAVECPICFLYYPPYLNATRCCDQSICSECFVQIKRPDPHVPEHGDNLSSPMPGRESSPSGTLPEGSLVSEPAACPFCVQPEFGVTYEPPAFRRGLSYSIPTSTPTVTSITSTTSSTISLASSGGFARRRAKSLSAATSSVITTDTIRPDWAQKLSNARAHAARRAAAATALHTAAYLIGNGIGPERPLIFGRQSRLLRRVASGGEASASSSRRLDMNSLAALAERRNNSHTEPDATTEASESRRSRVDDLEEMMIMEAIRLSLASEEERKRNEA
ncbi:MAG: SNF1-interacting protein [Trizodia sp. TS-e1964]|nr:MAG: SNF1-interacting protein [Trizodia sp. TS-e1964]